MNQKAIAVYCLEALDIYKPYIRRFNSKTGIPCFFENYAGFYADQEPELMNKIAEIEQTYTCLVYAITHEVTDLGEMWSMLCVPQGVECAEDVLMDMDSGYTNQHYVFAYVWNKSNDDWSEFGDICVKSFGGGIKRIH